MYAFIIEKAVFTDKEICTKYLISAIYAILSRKIHSTPLFTVSSNKNKNLYDMGDKQNICPGFDLSRPPLCCPGVGDVPPAPTKGHDYEHLEDIYAPSCDTEGETTKQNNASNHNNSSPSSSLSCRPSLHSKPNKMCVTNNSGNDDDDNDPRKSNGERVKKQCEIEDNNEIFFDTLETSLKTILDVSAESASNTSLKKRSPVITITPASEDNVAEAPVIFARRPRTRSDNLYKNLLLKYQHEAEASPCSTRPRSYSESDLKILTVAQSGNYVMTEAGDSRVVYRDTLLESSYYNKSDITQLSLEFWKRKISVIDVESLPQEDISDLSIIGGTLSPISRPVINPLRRLFAGIAKIIRSELSTNDELNSCVITRSKGNLCRMNIKNILPSNRDLTAPIGFINLKATVNLTILPKSRNSFCHNLVSIDLKPGSLILLDPRITKDARILIPEQRRYLNSDYLFLTLYKRKSENKPEITPKKVITSAFCSQEAPDQATSQIEVINSKATSADSPSVEIAQDILAENSGLSTDIIASNSGSSTDDRASKISILEMNVIELQRELKTHKSVLDSLLSQDSTLKSSCIKTIPSSEGDRETTR